MYVCETVFNIEQVLRAVAKDISYNISYFCSDRIKSI